MVYFPSHKKRKTPRRRKKPVASVRVVEARHYFLQILHGVKNRCGIVGIADVQLSKRDYVCVCRPAGPHLCSLCLSSHVSRESSEDGWICFNLFFHCVLLKKKIRETHIVWHIAVSVNP